MLQNRVDPLGELVATPARGLVYGNRGCLHDAAGNVRRRFRGWHRTPPMQPGRFTELFFLDEATALAAGHRPCALCRRADYDRLVTIWREHHQGAFAADAIDARLHAERVDAQTRRQRTHAAQLDRLPDGAFVLSEQEAWLVLADELLRWTPGGYAERRRKSADGAVRLLTPPSLVTTLRGGWHPLVPLLHPSALSAVS